MSMTDLERALRLIDENEGVADFVGSRDDRLIEAAESALDAEFPPTYREFLKRKGCGSIAGAEFYGIIDNNFYNSSVPNGIWLTLDERKLSNLPKGLVLVSDSGDGGYFALDLDRRSRQGEAPVVLWFPGLSEQVSQGEQVAEDFGAFIFGRLRRALGG